MTFLERATALLDDLPDVHTEDEVRALPWRVLIPAFWTCFKITFWGTLAYIEEETRA